MSLLDVPGMTFVKTTKSKLRRKEEIEGQMDE